MRLVNKNGDMVYEPLNLENIMVIAKRATQYSSTNKFFHLKESTDFDMRNRPLDVKATGRPIRCKSLLTTRQSFLYTKPVRDSKH
jgi:hypothetical protein